jgi:transposase
MLALDPGVSGPVWSAVEALLPPRLPDTHPLGCHRARRADRDCFWGILIRLVTGCSWDVAGRLSGVGETTLRNRRTEWVQAGVFDRLGEEAICAYDRIIGLDLQEVAVDGSLHKAPCGGEGTGPNPTDRSKAGWKWSIATDTAGIPVGWAIDGANRNDCKMLEPTLDAVASRGLLADIVTLHLDRGYDNGPVVQACVARGLTDTVIAKKRKRGQGGTNKLLTLGLRWPVERTNSWLSNFGQMRRNTDRFPGQRLAQMALAVTLILTVKLVKYAKRWNG